MESYNNNTNLIIHTKKFLFMCALLFSVILASLILSVQAHGRLLHPPARSSLWRFPEFQQYNPRVNWNDNEVDCGGRNVQWERNGGKCGVCGDRWDAREPRDHEDGGIYGKGIIVASYYPGQVHSNSIFFIIVNFVVEITTSHLGFFRLRLCPRNSLSTPLTQDCFNEHRLYFTDNSGIPLGTSYKVGNSPGFYNASVIIPKDVKCSKCVIQWQYKTGNTWGTCKNNTDKTGCGHQEFFRACADVQIL